MSVRQWTSSVRWIEGQIDRATLRTTLTCQVHPRVSLGVEWNPLADDVNPLANVLVLDETTTRPAVIVGTSSDRIGTPHGQSVYATVSKNLRRETGLPIAPYVGAAYGTFDDEVRPIGGLSIGFTEALQALVIYDGEHVHPTLSWSIGRHVLTFLLVEGTHPGVAYSVQFDLPFVAAESGDR